MDVVVDFLRRNRDLIWKIAVGAALLSIFYPLVANYYLWIGGEGVIADRPNVSFWVLGNYFFDPLIAAIVLGALARNWRAAYIAVVGLVAQLVLVTGALITDNESIANAGDFSEDDISAFQVDLQLYLVSTVRWIWILGLIAFGVALGRKLGDMFSELDDEAPAAPPSA